MIGSAVSEPPVPGTMRTSRSDAFGCVSSAFLASFKPSSPGREAYPCDVFYLHSRLLERAAKVREDYIVVAKDAPADTKVGVDGAKHEGEDGAKEAQKALDAMANASSLEVRMVPGTGGSLTAL